MAHALGKELSDIAVYGREGESPREPGTIGYHSLRAGNIPSSHTVYFGGMGERLEITHHSYNWECFARGACDCAAYLEGKGPGFYSIKDVLGIKSTNEWIKHRTTKNPPLAVPYERMAIKIKGTFPCIKVCTGMYLLFYSGRISTFSHIKQSDLPARPWTSHPYLS